jgi:hypothetical protein
MSDVRRETRVFMGLVLNEPGVVVGVPASGKHA